MHLTQRKWRNDHTNRDGSRSDGNGSDGTPGCPVKKQMTNDPEDRLLTAQEPGNPATNLDERHVDKAASSAGNQVRAAAPLTGSDILAVVFRGRT
jgi:hypothetical protein